jgi:hypothetical protein
MEAETLQYPRKEQNGYIKINIEGLWIFEHRYIMEKYLGRNITKEEKIHHDDFNRKNNIISNLTLFPDNKSHTHFHRQIKQFGMTRPRLKELKELKLNMIKIKCASKN